MMCDLSEVRIRPSRMRVFVDAWRFAPLIPCQSEPVRVYRRFANKSVFTLLYKGLFLFENEFIQIPLGTMPRYKPTHMTTPTKTVPCSHPLDIAPSVHVLPARPNLPL